MNISICIAPINDGVQLVEVLLKEEFGISEMNLRVLTQEGVKPHF